MRLSTRYSLSAVTALAAAFILPGCASAPEAGGYEASPVRKATPRLQRERVMQTAWRGQSYYSLLAKYGPPRAVMTHPGLRAGSGEIVLYGVRDIASNCIDAFTVITPTSSGDRIIADYFCR